MNIKFIKIVKFLILSISLSSCLSCSLFGKLSFQKVPAKICMEIYEDDIKRSNVILSEGYALGSGFSKKKAREHARDHVDNCFDDWIISGMPKRKACDDINVTLKFPSHRNIAQKAAEQMRKLCNSKSRGSIFSVFITLEVDNKLEVATDFDILRCNGSFVLPTSPLPFPQF